MKIKTSITLSRDVYAALEKAAPERERSGFIESVLRSHFSLSEARRREARDAAILEKSHVGLNREAEDVLEYRFEG